MIERHGQARSKTTPEFREIDIRRHRHLSDARPAYCEPRISIEYREKTPAVRLRKRSSYQLSKPFFPGDGDEQLREIRRVVERDSPTRRRLFARVQEIFLVRATQMHALKHRVRELVRSGQIVEVEGRLIWAPSREEREFCPE